MNVHPSRMSRHRPASVRRFTAGQLLVALLMSAALIGVVGLDLVLARDPMEGADAYVVGQIAFLLLAPPVLFGVAACVARGAAAVREARRCRALRRLQPTGPPIQQVAADLRRLLCKYDLYARSTGRSSYELRPLEVRISETAMQAARALGVSHKDPPLYGAFDIDQLGKLLRVLMDEGLVLPADVSLVAPESHI